MHHLPTCSYQHRIHSSNRPHGDNVRPRIRTTPPAPAWIAEKRGRLGWQMDCPDRHVGRRQLQIGSGGHHIRWGIDISGMGARPSGRRSLWDMGGMVGCFFRPCYLRKSWWGGGGVDDPPFPTFPSRVEKISPPIPSATRKTWSSGNMSMDHIRKSSQLAVAGQVGLRWCAEQYHRNQLFLSLFSP